MELSSLTLETDASVCGQIHGEWLHLLGKAMKGHADVSHGATRVPASMCGLISGSIH